MSDRLGAWFSVLSVATHVKRQILKRMRQEHLEFKAIWAYTACVELHAA